MSRTAIKTDAGDRIRGSRSTIFLKKAQALPVEEALRRADGEGRVMLSNKRMSSDYKGMKNHDLRLYRSMIDESPFWTGTLFAYEKRGGEIGKEIVYEDGRTKVRYIFPVPSEHQGKRDAVLVAEHPDFILAADGNDRVVQASKVGIVEGFPGRERYNVPCWFVGDPIYEIPQGEDNYIRSWEPNRYLRRRDGAMVGLVSRYFNHSHAGGSGRYVEMHVDPSEPRSVMVEEREMPDAPGPADGAGEGAKEERRTEPARKADGRGIGQGDRKAAGHDPSWGAAGHHRPHREAEGEGGLLIICKEGALAWKMLSPCPVFPPNARPSVFSVSLSCPIQGRKTSGSLMAD